VGEYYPAVKRAKGEDWPKASVMSKTDRKQWGQREGQKLVHARYKGRDMQKARAAINLCLPGNWTGRGPQEGREVKKKEKAKSVRLKDVSWE